MGVWNMIFWEATNYENLFKYLIIKQKQIMTNQIKIKNLVI
jgi:hypothetical protein